MLRPFIELSRAAQRVISALVALHAAAAEALGEPDMRLAQRRQIQLQAALDLAGAAAFDAAEVAAALQRLIHTEDPLGGWLAEAFSGDPLSALDRGKDAFRRNIGTECGDATSLLALVWDRFANIAGDVQQFWRIVREHRTILLDNIERLRAVVGEPLYAERVAAVMHDMWSSARRALVDPATDREAVTDVLEAGHIVVEQALKFHLGIVCAATTRLNFADTQASGVSQLANIADSRRWSVGEFVQAAPFRNAFAHRDYSIREGSIHLSPLRCRARNQPVQAVTFGEVTNAVLAFVEVSGAMELALSSVIETDGRGINCGVPNSFLASAALVGVGWRDVDVRVEGQDIFVRASVDHPVRMSTLCFAATPFLVGYGVLSVCLVRDGTRREVRLPLEAYVTWLGAEGDAKEGAFIKMARAMEIDGRPFMSVDQASKYIAARVADFITEREEPPPLRNSRVGFWREVARSTRCVSLDAAIWRARQWRMYVDSGLAPDADMLDALIATASAKVDEISYELI